MEHDKRHGGPYDRGSADAYYRRDFDPHYYEGAKRIPIEAGTPEYLSLIHISEPTRPY